MTTSSRRLLNLMESPTEASGNRRGVRNEIAIGGADTVVMPLSPLMTVALDYLGIDHTVDAAYVRKLNTWQLEAAREHVFMHPGSALMTWVEKTRPPTSPSIAPNDRPNLFQD